MSTLPFLTILAKELFLPFGIMMKSLYHIPIHDPFSSPKRINLHKAIRIRTPPSEQANP